MNGKLAKWLLGDIPADYPADRLRGWQGWRGVKKQIRNEYVRQRVVGRHRSKAYPSGLIVNHVRICIVRLNYARIQVLIDEFRDRAAFEVLNRKGRTSEEISTWRDRYYLSRFVYFLISLFLLPSLPIVVKYFLFAVSSLLILDMLGGLAGSALIWYKESVSFERTFIVSLMNYAELIVAFAGFYRACDCLNVSNPDVLQALYFSTVAATTVGFGDILPLNSTGRDPCGCPAPVNHLALFLVIAQLALFVLFLLVFVNLFLTRAQSNRT